MAQLKQNRTRRSCMLCGQPVITTTQITRTGQTVYRNTEHVNPCEDPATRCRYQSAPGAQPADQILSAYPGDTDNRASLNDR
jgi:hypothetical protein